MVTTLYLVRHGQTEGDGEARYRGSIDVPLSAEGIRQVEETARRLSARLAATAALRPRDYLHAVQGLKPAATAPRPAAVFCSPLSRARVSADIIAAPFGLAPIPVTELRERHFGVWEGMSFEEIRAAWPGHFAAWAANPLGFSPPEGENTLEVARRGRSAIKKILARHPGESVAVVAHGGINRVILCHFLQLPLRHLFRIEQGLACLNIIELWDNYPVTKLLNG